MSENSWWELFYMNLRDQAQVIMIGAITPHLAKPPKPRYKANKIIY